MVAGVNRAWLGQFALRGGVAIWTAGDYSKARCRVTHHKYVF